MQVIVPAFNLGIVADTCVYTHLFIPLVTRNLACNATHPPSTYGFNMKKLVLNFDDLSVDSFKTAETVGGRGTVQAFETGTDSCTSDWELRPVLQTMPTCYACTG
jgi:hypothetical protein